MKLALTTPQLEALFAQDPELQAELTKQVQANYAQKMAMLIATNMAQQARPTIDNEVRRLLETMTWPPKVTDEYKTRIHEEVTKQVDYAVQTCLSRLNLQELVAQAVEKKITGMVEYQLSTRIKMHEEVNRYIADAMQKELEGKIKVRITLDRE